MKNKLRFCLFCLCTAILCACIKDRNFVSPKDSCAIDLIASASYAEVKNLYVDETIQIQQDLIIEGYVISSDRAGNFFNVLHFQDSPINPKDGFQIEIDVRDSHLLYPVGSKIFIKLKGLYLGKSKDVFKLGGVFISFGNVSVGRLPSAQVDNHIFVSCDGPTNIEPIEINIADIGQEFTNTLVKLSDVQIIEDELGLAFADVREETERTLTDCNKNQITLLNSGFADFQSEVLPEGNGSITGVLLQEKDNYRLIVRDLSDIDFTKDRCEDSINVFTSNQIFISELADPENNTGARFVELYNSSDEDLDLDGWTLQRYTNDNLEVSSTINLSNFTIQGQSTFVISPDSAEFESVYGFLPDLGVGSNSPADSNGDDNLLLVDPFGVVIDAFGIIGEDGSGTNHEFEDGRAKRKSEITVGNANYTFSEWVIYNDSGGSGTINQPQIAPTNFSPGVRE